MKADDLLTLYRNINQFGKEIGLEYELLPDSTFLNRITIRAKHLSTPTVAHGAVVAALADSTLGLAALSVATKTENIVSTIEFKINYLKPVSLGDVITGIPKIRQIGKKIIFVDADFFNQNEELIATASGTFNQYPAVKLF